MVVLLCSDVNLNGLEVQLRWKSNCDENPKRLFKTIEMIHKPQNGKLFQES